MESNGFGSSVSCNNGAGKPGQKTTNASNLLPSDETSVHKVKTTTGESIKHLVGPRSVSTVLTAQPSKRWTLRQLAEDVMVVATNGIVSTPPPAFRSRNNTASQSPSASPCTERRAVVGFRISPSGSPVIPARGSPSVNSPRLRGWSPKNSPRLAKASLHKSHTGK